MMLEDKDQELSLADERRKVGISLERSMMTQHTAAMEELYKSAIAEQASKEAEVRSLRESTHNLAVASLKAAGEAEAAWAQHQVIQYK